MIQRVNLISKKAFSVTKALLVRIFFGVIILIGGLVGYKFYQVGQLRPQILMAKQKLQKLQAEKKELEKTPVVKKQQTVEVGEYQDLFEVLNAYPKWALIVEEVTYNLPNSLWLNGVAVEIVGEKQAGATKKGKKKKEEEEEKPAANISKLKRPAAIKLVLTGLATEVDALSSFVKNLQASKYFKRTIIEDSNKENFGFQFTISSYIDLDYVE